LPREYLHGFAPEEQRRLVRQAEYWRRSLIPLGLSYRSGDRVLEIGCAAGATLAVLVTTFPGIQPAGIDLEPSQIEFARRHFAFLHLAEPDLRVGDARALPWGSESFDHVYLMWFLEHVKDAAPVLHEAHRVLRPGGTIAVTETDYTTFKVLPSSSSWEYLESAQYEFFARHGNPVAGRQLGVLLAASGFVRVRNVPVGFHFFADGGDGLRGHVEYVAEFLEPGLTKLAELGFDPDRLQQGLAWLRSVPGRPDGCMSQIVYRAHAVKAAARRGSGRSDRLVGSA
jgi:ubiquinone/menaquinone biosynthesis C-methylase UbiE